MGYEKAKGRSKQTFVMARYDIMESKAWLSLSPYARALWLVLMKRYNGSNNGKIALSIREGALECNMSHGKAKKSFDDLLERGFIKIALDSSFNFKMKQSRRWIVTHEGYDKKAPTNEWRNWITKSE